MPIKFILALNSTKKEEKEQGKAFYSNRKFILTLRLLVHKRPYLSEFYKHLHIIYHQLTPQTKANFSSNLSKDSQLRCNMALQLVIDEDLRERFREIFGKQGFHLSCLNSYRILMSEQLVRPIVKRTAFDK